MFSSEIYKSILEFVAQNTCWINLISRASKDIIIDKVESDFSLEFKFVENPKNTISKMRLLGMPYKKISDNFLVCKMREKSFAVFCSRACCIDSSAFQNLSLHNITSSVYNENYSINQDLTIKTLVLKIDSLTIDETVNTIFPYAFKGVDANKLVIGSSIKNIRENAFEYSSFIDVDLENADITTLPRGAFSHCKNLKSIKLPNNLQQIDEVSFEGCVSLEEIDIPNSVIEIGDGAFEDCYKLKKVKLSNNLKILGNYAFALTEIRNIVLPNSLESLGESAFFYSSLEAITLPNGLKEVSPYVFSFAVNLKKVIIPSSVTKIEEKSFVECCNLKEIHIPNSVTHIAKDAFWDTDIRPRDYENPLVLVGSKDSYVNKYAIEFRYGFREE